MKISLKKKISTLLAVSMLCCQLAGAYTTTQNTYSVLGTILKTVEIGSDGVVGNTTLYDAYQRPVQVTSVSGGVTSVATYAYNALSEVSTVTTVKSDGSTMLQTVTNHGADTVTMVKSPVSGTNPDGSQKWVMAAVSHTSPNGDSVTFNFNSDMGEGTNRVVSISITTMWGDTKTYKEGESINGVSWADYVHNAGLCDPLVQGTVQEVTEINGVKYAVVKADKIDMYDGKGAQPADGEVIYVAVDDATYATLQGQLESASKTGEAVAITVSGNVTADVNGNKSMTMNQGGYESAIGKTSDQVAATWMAKNQTFYNTMKAQMSSVWAAANATGQNNDWSAGWSFLTNIVTGGQANPEVQAAITAGAAQQAANAQANF